MKPISNTVLAIISLTLSVGLLAVLAGIGFFTMIYSPP